MKSLATVKIAPFTILVDNREQCPYHFGSVPPGYGFTMAKMVTSFLPTGDYSVAGHEDRFAVERKSLEDLYSTLGQNRNRFEAEVQRLNEMDFAAIIVEADLRNLWRPSESRPDWRSRLSPASVEGTIVAWSIRYPRVHWWPVGSRRAGELRTLGACAKFWKHAQHE